MHGIVPMRSLSIVTSIIVLKKIAFYDDGHKTIFFVDLLLFLLDGLSFWSLHALNVENERNHSLCTTCHFNFVEVDGNTRLNHFCAY